ncbi:hypothetical protein BDL97_05G138700 [Sphagnum fallax]|nr:hypothetical protein BDL97_05G138700 [Sphagnum fallax]
MGQLVAEETAKRGELQDAQAEEGLKQHEAGGDYDPIVFVWPPTGSKDDCDLLLELQGTPASSRFLDACFVKVAATCCGGEQLE